MTDKVKKSFCITTDSMSDLPDEYLKKHGIEVISLTYMLDGVMYNRDNGVSYKEFYDRMRKGSMPTSSQFNPKDAELIFERLIEQYDQDILHLSISSGMSGSYSSAQVGAQVVMERHPERKILVIDTLGASLGEGLLVAFAVDRRDEGFGIEEVYEKVEQIKLNCCHLLTVADIVYLYRGGRVSRTTAFVGGMLDIKPLIHVDNEGRLVPNGKVRGRKRSLMALVDGMEKQIGSFKDRNKTIYITHGDTVEDAEFLAEQIEKRMGFKNFMINHLGTTIGVHTGPGLIALFFLGDIR